MTVPTCCVCGVRADLITANGADGIARTACQACRDLALVIVRQVPGSLTKRALTHAERIGA